MLGVAHSNRLECHFALIAHELSNLNVDLGALSEVHFPGEGNLQEHGTGYTLFWSGKPTTEERLSGVGFMDSTSITSRLENLPTGHSDSMMSMCLPLKNKRYAILFCVYAPALWGEPAEKDKFYSELRICFQSTPTKVIIFGDFNARVDQNADSCKGVLGRYRFVNCNDNWHLLLKLCSEQQLVITDTIFQQKDRLKTTWMHLRSKHWHLIEYILLHNVTSTSFTPKWYPTLNAIPTNT